MKDVQRYNKGSFVSSTGGSNFYFSQLIAGGYVDEESAFYSSSLYGEEPDNDMSTPDKMLAPGEVGFAYVLWDHPKSGLLPGHAPLVLTYAEGWQKSLFRPSGWFRPVRRWLVVLRVDMSLEVYDAKGDAVMMRNGKDFFDWSQPHWDGQKPKIVWPE